MRATACATLAVLLLLSATALAAEQVERFQQRAVLGTTRLFISSTVTTLSSAPGRERFRVTGSLAILADNVPPFHADPWSVIDAGVGSGGVITDITAIDITSARLAYLAGKPQADAVLLWMACGANCGGDSAILTYDVARHTYVVASWVRQQGWDTIPYGTFVRVEPHRDVLATHVPGPFDDCHACLPGVVPVYYAVTGEHIVDISRRFPRALAADAVAAWRAAQHESSGGDPTDREIELFRYLADACRIGSCDAAWRRLEATLPGNDTKDALARMRGAIDSGGYGNL